MMAKSKEIEVEFDENDPDQMRIETLEGIEGGECTDILDKLNHLMQAEDISKKDKYGKNKEQHVAHKNKQELK